MHRSLTLPVLDTWTPSSKRAHSSCLSRQLAKQRFVSLPRLRRTFPCSEPVWCHMMQGSTGALPALVTLSGRDISAGTEESL